MPHSDIVKGQAQRPGFSPTPLDAGSELFFHLGDIILQLGVVVQDSSISLE